MKLPADQLTEILDLHKKWLYNLDGGKQANLSEADLSWVNLSEADLSEAILFRANLKGAILTGIIEK